MIIDDIEISREESLHKRFNYPDTPNNYKIGETVYCPYIHPEKGYTESFGEIVDYIEPSQYVVALPTGKFLTANVLQITKSGRA